MFKLREWLIDRWQPAPRRHPGLDEPFTAATSGAEHVELLTRWREIALWVRTIPQGTVLPDWWSAHEHCALAVIEAGEREWTVAGVTASNGEVGPVPVADALEYLGKVLAVDDTAAVAAAVAELRLDFAWAKTEDADCLALRDLYRGYRARLAKNAVIALCWWRSVCCNGTDDTSLRKASSGSFFISVNARSVSAYEVDFPWVW